MMNGLIIYMSSHGCASKAASLILENFNGSPYCAFTLVNLGEDEVPDLSLYDAVIIGGSIRIGTLQKRLKKFVEKNLDHLLRKRIGLFICCMYEGKKAEEQLQQNFPAPLVKHATALGYFGGELNFDVMNAFERMIIKDIIGISVNVSQFNEKAVGQFVSRLHDTPATDSK
jgi:menaquinone-dependent protoporphyrinogen oxidase